MLSISTLCSFLALAASIHHYIDGGLKSMINDDWGRWASALVDLILWQSWELVDSLPELILMDSIWIIYAVSFIIKPKHQTSQYLCLKSQHRILNQCKVP